MIIDELTAVLGFQYRGKGELDQFTRGMGEAKRNADDFVGGLGRIATAAAAAFAAIGGAVVITSGIGRFVSSLTAVNAEFEGYEATLKTITGSAEEASKAMDWISQFARETPYAANEVTQAFVRMKAYGIDPTTGALKTVGDASSALGKDMMSGVEAIADAITGENERLKEFGITTSVAGDKITYNWKEDGKDLSKTVRKNATEIQTAVLGIMSRFDGAMDDQAKTWNGMTSNLLENWTDFLRAVGGAGYYDDIKRRLQVLLDWTARGWSSGFFSGVAQRVSDGLVSSLDVAQQLSIQAYRIGRGFYSAADGVAALVSQTTGLSKGMSASGLAVGALASSAFGRRAMLAVASRVPMLGALALGEDLLGALNGDDSWIGSTKQGAEAVDKLRASIVALNEAGTRFGTVFAEFGINVAKAFNIPESAFKDVRSLEEFGRESWKSSAQKFGWGQGAQDGMQDTGGYIGATLDTYAARIGLIFTDPMKLLENRVTDFLNNCQSVITAINQVMDAFRLSIDGFNRIFFSEAKAQEGAKPTVTVGGGAGKSTAAAARFDPDGSLTRDGMQQAEGLRHDYGVTPEHLMNGASVVAKAILDMSSFQGSYDLASRMLTDLQATTEAKLDLNITSFSAKLAQAKAELAQFKASVGSGISAGVGLPPARTVGAGVAP